MHSSIVREKYITLRYTHINTRHVALKHIRGEQRLGVPCSPAEGITRASVSAGRHDNAAAGTRIARSLRKWISRRQWQRNASLL